MIRSNDKWIRSLYPSPAQPDSNRLTNRIRDGRTGLMVGNSFRFCLRLSDTAVKMLQISPLSVLGEGEENKQTN